MEKENIKQKVTENLAGKESVIGKEKTHPGVRGDRLAAVRIRGVTGIKKPIKDTLSMLKLYRANYCVVLDSKPSMLGMLKLVKDYVTWGEIDDTTYKFLVEKRGELYKGRETDSKNKLKYSSRFVEVDGKKINAFFKLNSPLKGYGRQGVKFSFVKGGSLGYRGDKINDLIKRMV